MEYHGLEVIITMPSDTTDPLTHPVDQMSIGVKTQGVGAWISMAQIIKLLAENMVHLPHDMEPGETELQVKHG